MNRQKILLGCPLYDDRLYVKTATALFSTASKNHEVKVFRHAGSLLTVNCNVLWCEALGLRETQNFDWFAMLHADIEPSLWWLDTLMQEAEAHGADMISAVIPFKDGQGLTSTALARPGTLHSALPPGCFCRLTMAQVRDPLFPNTFGASEAADGLARLPDAARVDGAPREALYVNTGCFAVRLDRPWREKLWFTQVDGIVRVDGKWHVRSEPEDWNFSRRVAQEGGKVMATRLVEVTHWGTHGFKSTDVWGSPRDPLIGT